MTQNEVTGNKAQRGFVFRLEGKDSEVVLSGNEISVSGTGVELDFKNTGGEVLLESNKISGRENIQISGPSSAVIDLGGGTLGSSGKNRLRSSKYSIKYELPPYNGALYAKNNTWEYAHGNTFEPPSVLEGPSDTDHFYIEDEGNKIVFSD